MLRSAPIAKVLSPMLAILVVVATFPFAALAESHPVPSASLIGSLSAVGSVELRGVAISRDGTLFSGDTIRTREDGYVSIALSGGQQIELSRDTDVRVDAGGNAVQIAMNSGQLVFATPVAGFPMKINVSPYEILVGQGATGDVAFLSAGELGIRALSGTVTVRSAEGGESVVVREGEAEVINLGGTSGPGTLPPPQQQSNRGRQAAVWIGVALGAAALAAYHLVQEASPSNP